MQTFILTECPEDDYAYIEWKKNGIDCDIIFKRRSKFFRGIRRIWFRWKLPFRQIWYRKWQECVKSAEVVVFHVSYLSLNLAEYINKLNPRAKVIAWYWNKVDEKTTPDKVTGNCEIWSFDPSDCKKFGLKFNHQYYFKSFMPKSCSNLYDVYFVGSDSGRGKEILAYYNFFAKNGIKTKFQVVYPQLEELPCEIVSDVVDYSEVRAYIEKSRCILELVREGQTGPTLRTMEAVFFNKKLITNNVYVLEEPFYDSDKIFLLGHRNIDELVEFIQSNKNIIYNDSLRDTFDVNMWVNNFSQ